MLNPVNLELNLFTVTCFVSLQPCSWIPIMSLSKKIYGFVLFLLFLMLLLLLFLCDCNVFVNHRWLSVNYQKSNTVHIPTRYYNYYYYLNSFNIVYYYYCCCIVLICIICTARFRSTYPLFSFFSSKIIFSELEHNLEQPFPEEIHNIVILWLLLSSTTWLSLELPGPQDSCYSYVVLFINLYSFKL